MIVPIEVATNGYIGTGLNTLSIAVDGYLMTVTIETIPISGGFLVKGLSHNMRRKQQERREKWKKEYPHKSEKEYEEECEIEYIKKITVTLTINNEKFSETKYIDDIPDLSVEDVDIQIVEKNEKPKIKITVIKK